MPARKRYIMSDRTQSPRSHRKSPWAPWTGLLSVVFLFVYASAYATEPALKHWKVDGVDREALIFAPAIAAKTPAPVVFAFHGHGGRIRDTAALFAYQKHWPEAIVVYMQGLNTPGAFTDFEGKEPGWQRVFGQEKDRDLKFFDAVLATLKQDYKIDEKRIYATGHSNGGAFTYFLWAARGDVFAAVAPCAAMTGRGLREHFKPKPVFHLAGEKDALVKYSWQQQTIEAVRKINQCGDGKPWADHCTLYSSKTGSPVVTCIHPGGHELPGYVPPLIVKFFKEHPRRDKDE
jgi:polyhydroxybutyrate depolymerase